MKQLKYKALMSDIDGTLIPNNSKDNLPSKKVEEAIAKGSKKIHIGVATSRPLSFANKILTHLNLTSPCIITGGAQIYDPQTKKIIYEKNMNKDSVSEIFKVINKFNLTLLDDGRGTMEDIKEKNVTHFTQFWIKLNNQTDLEEVFKDLSSIPEVSVHKIVSRFDNNHLELILNHTEATKQHGILKVAEILNLDTKEFIGIGDGYNDFPLLMACGLKVAMGNAVEDLKEIADYIAPSVEKDGVADVINKFVLKNG